jgi:protein-S-isoprenylcysteine O-methyltransferase Ste14
VVFAASALHVAWMGMQGAPQRPWPVTLGVVAVHVVMAGLFLVRLPESGPPRVASWLPALPSLALGAFVGGSPGLRFSPLAALLFSLGALGTLLSMLALGRSFAVLPGARRLVARGPYRLVRHPMYASELLMFAGLVLHLHALLAAGLLVLVGLALAWRITAEERALAALVDHAEYTARVRHRLIPGVW